jgi:hypothetical protein
MEPVSNPSLVVRLVRYHTDQSTALYVDLTLQERRLESVFNELVVEILARLVRGEAPQVAVNGVIRDFRELLSARSGGMAPYRTIVGLLGELLVLERLLSYSSDAVATWRGPHEQRHDFRHGSRAIEVKTSTRSDSSRIAVSGLDQLAAPAGGSLLLVHVRLEPAARGTVSVGGLVDRILAKGGNKDQLDAGLEKLGCSVPVPEEWQESSFELEGLDLYLVEASFPRLVASDLVSQKLSAGVEGIEYRVDLSHAGTSRVPGARIPVLLEEFTV